MQILFIMFGLGYALPGLWLSGWLDSGAGIALGSVALVFVVTRLGTQRSNSFHVDFSDFRGIAVTKWVHHKIFDS